ncbi:MAG: hypothetical protein R3E95_17485 [Thiolinea sp.]
MGAWAMALLAGLVVYFSGDLIHWLELGKGQGQRLQDVSEVIAMLLAFAGTVALCIQLLIVFVLPPRS